MNVANNQKCCFERHKETSNPPIVEANILFEAFPIDKNTLKRLSIGLYRACLPFTLHHFTLNRLRNSAKPC